MYVRTDGGIQGNLIADRITYPSYMKRNFKNVTWGKFPDNSFLASFNVFPLSDNPPTFDTQTQRKTNLESTYDSETGGWVTNYLVEDIPQEELDSIAQSEKESALQNIRSQRDSLLKQSDWVMTLDAPIYNKNQWAVYRQQLRDITTQHANPNLIVFPQEPPLVTSAEKTNKNYSGVFSPFGSPSS